MRNRDNIKIYPLSCKRKKEEEGKNDTNYFRVMKEIEKEQKIRESPKKYNKINTHNLTEQIYIKNSKKVENYYDKNKDDLLLYGSKRYDLLTVQKLVKEMDKYRPKVLSKIKEDKNKINKAKNYNFESCDEKVILTPLAQTEKKNKNISESLEKKKFEDAQRSGVVMRRIEYVHLLENRNPFKKIEINQEEEDKKFFLLIKEAVDRIERNWFYHNWLKQKMKKWKEKMEMDKKNKLRNKNNNNTNNTLDKSKPEKEKENKFSKENFYFQLINEKNQEKNLLNLLEKVSKENKYTQTQLNEGINNKKDINKELNKIKKEYDELKQSHNTLTESYNAILNESNNTKKDLNNAINDNKLLTKKISDLNNTLKTMDTDKEKKSNELQTVISIITNEKDNKDKEIKNIKLDLEQKTKKINDYENEINNLKSQILEQNKINENNLNKNLEVYKNNIILLEKEKEDLKDSIQILEEISNSNKEQYNKLYFQNKNDIKKLNKEKKELQNELIKLKQELDKIKKKQQTEKSSELNQFNEIDEYEKKISNLNKIIEELKARIQNLYYQVSFLQKSDKFNKNSDIIIKLKLAIILIRNYIHKNIIFDKREFFNILMKKCGRSFFAREKRIEFLRDHRPNNFPY